MVSGESLFLLNPGQVDFQEVAIGKVEGVLFDRRLRLLE